MISTNIGPTTTRCCLRIIDDILNHTEMVEIDRDRGEILTELLLMQKYLRQAKSLIRLCVHVSYEVVTLHWWAEDTYYVKAVVSMGTIQIRALECLKVGEVLK